MPAKAESFTRVVCLSTLPFPGWKPLIREARAADEWQVEKNTKDGATLNTATTDDEKHENASACVRKLDLKMPALIDGLNNKVQLTYSGWPDRLIGRDGPVAFKGPRGPAGFRPPLLEAAIIKELGLAKP